MSNQLLEFLEKSYTAYQAVDNSKKLLLANGFLSLKENEDWELNEGGKYFVERNGSSIIAFVIGDLDNFSFKIVASHTDSPALKLKENAILENNGYIKLNTETYGGGIFYSFLDRPLKIAGRVVAKTDTVLKSVNAESNYVVTIPSLAIHMNRDVNSNLSLNPQTDLLPLIALSNSANKDDFLKDISEVNSEDIISYDLYLVNSDKPYRFGLNNEFVASPRIDNLSSVYSSLEAIISHKPSNGIAVAACLDNEEIGSQTMQGAGGDFLETVLRRINYSFRFDDSEYYKALSSSFLVSADNAHAIHPNHPEKCDITNKSVMGGGIVIKSHANHAYTTDAISSAILKSIFEKAGVKYQMFFNRSDMRSGGTLGAISLSHISIMAADIGLAQLAMHSANECFCESDYDELVNGLTAFYSTDIIIDNNEITLK